jgi:hypothetical protein
MDPNIKNDGFITAKAESTGVVTAGATLTFKQLKVYPKSNRILVEGSVVTSGSAGTGTSPASLMLKSMKIWKGDERAALDKTKLVLDADLATLIHAHTIAQALLPFPTPVTATMPSFLNPALAGDATYKFAFEIKLNLLQGEYYAEIEIASPSDLAGYSTIPTANTSVGLTFEDLGVPFARAEKLTLTRKTNTAFTTKPAKQIAFLCTTEISSVLASLNYVKGYNGYQVKAVESATARKTARAMAQAAASTLPYAYSPGNPEIPAGTVYYAFVRTNNSAYVAELQVTSAKEVIVGFYEDA